MFTRRRAAVPAGLLVSALVTGGIALAAPQAQAANGVFVWEGKEGQQSIPFPEEDKCYATPGGKVGNNYSAGDAYLYTDAKCTIGKDAGNIGPFASRTVDFEGVRLRTSGS